MGFLGQLGIGGTGGNLGCFGDWFGLGLGIRVVLAYLHSG